MYYVCLKYRQHNAKNVSKFGCIAVKYKVFRLKRGIEGVQLFNSKVEIM